MSIFVSSRAFSIGSVCSFKLWVCCTDCIAVCVFLTIALYTVNIDTTGQLERVQWYPVVLCNMVLVKQHSAFSQYAFTGIIRGEIRIQRA